MAPELGLGILAPGLCLSLGETVNRIEILAIMRRQVVLLIDGKQALLSMGNPDTIDDQSMASRNPALQLFQEDRADKKRCERHDRGT